MPKQERIRVDIWTSLRPVIEAEMVRSGLSAQEVVNIALVDYFGLSPSGTKRHPIEPKVETTGSLNETSSTSDEDDYI